MKASDEVFGTHKSQSLRLLTLRAGLPSQTSRSTEGDMPPSTASAQLGPHLLNQRRRGLEVHPHRRHPLDQAGDVGQNTQPAIYRDHPHLAGRGQDRPGAAGGALVPRAAATTQSLSG